MSFSATRLSFTKPQGLKPTFLLGLGGTAEAVPIPKTARITLFPNL